MRRFKRWIAAAFIDWYLTTYLLRARRNASTATSPSSNKGNGLTLMKFAKAFMGKGLWAGTGPHISSWPGSTYSVKKQLEPINRNGSSFPFVSFVSFVSFVHCQSLIRWTMWRLMIGTGDGGWMPFRSPIFGQKVWSNHRFVLLVQFQGINYVRRKRNDLGRAVLIDEGKEGSSLCWFWRQKFIRGDFFCENKQSCKFRRPVFCKKKYGINNYKNVKYISIYFISLLLVIELFFSRLLIGSFATQIETGNNENYCLTFYLV